MSLHAIIHLILKITIVNLLILPPTYWGIQSYITALRLKIYTSEIEPWQMVPEAIFIFLC